MGSIGMALEDDERWEDMHEVAKQMGIKNFVFFGIGEDITCYCSQPMNAYEVRATLAMLLANQVALINLLEKAESNSPVPTGVH